MRNNQSSPELKESFAKACADLAGPLRAFLDHPLMDKKVATWIAEAFLEAKNTLPFVQTAGEECQCYLMDIKENHTLHLSKPESGE